MATQVCRVCFTSDVRMHPIDCIELQGMFEKVTNTKLHTHERPVTMCYICLPQLQKSYRFLKMCQTADEIFIDLITKGFEVNNHSLVKLKLASIQQLSLTVAPTQFLTFGNNSAKERSQIVKEELDEVEENADINQMVEDERDEQNGLLEESMESINSNNNDSQYANEGQIDIERNANQNKDVNYIMEDFQTVERSSPKNTHKTETHYYCDYCEAQFKTKMSLVLHIKEHMAVKPVSCNICAKTFSYICKMKQHMRTHTGEKPYSCNRCDKAFTINSSLQKHLRTHTGEKTYSCNRCDKPFRKKSNLIQHIRTHTGEIPYPCSRCDKGFSQESHLKQHMRIHIGERTYSCNKNTKTFSNNSNLEKDTVTHRIERRTKCSKCYSTARENANLRFHRFPLPGKHGSLRARVWAEYCFPDGNWSTEKSLKGLQSKHAMLCSNHFDLSSYTSSSKLRLNNFAIPTGAQDILFKLRQEQSDTCETSLANLQ